MRIFYSLRFGAYLYQKNNMGKVYCNTCKKNTLTANHFSWRWFLGGILTGGVISVLYLVYYIVTGDKKCKECGGGDYCKAKPETDGQ